MVTSPHALASAAGRDVLRAGGNAIEAAITIGAVLSVTYPHFTGLGGDAFWVIGDNAGAVLTLSGAGQAAAAPPHFDGAIPLRGGAAALTSAATLDTWARAFAHSQKAWGGKMSWSELFERAIEYAKDGFPVTQSQHFWQTLRADDLRSQPGFANTFAPEGHIPAPGERFAQPALARSLERIARFGAREFYEGELAERIARGLREAGSALTQADLAGTNAREEAPLRVPYRGGELISLQPPTQGVTTLQIMGTLERFDLSTIEEGSADYFHLLVEAVKCAFIDRDQYVCDPDFNDVPVETMLAPATLDAHARSIDLHHARRWPHVFQHGDTVFIGATDAAGRSVSLLQTIYFDWGSGVVAGDTGILWHNRGASFSIDPRHPNVLRPGKRPFHTLTPGMYLQAGRPRMLFGTQGADGQPQTLAAILTRLIDYGMDPLTALARPRFLLGKTFSDTRDALKIELDAGADVLAALAARGHEVSPIAAQSPLAGHPGVIAIDSNGHAQGAHDPRSDGLAMGV
jgi:oxamate amidohydrolase